MKIIQNLLEYLEFQNQIIQNQVEKFIETSICQFQTPCSFLDIIWLFAIAVIFVS